MNKYRPAKVESLPEKIRSEHRPSSGDIFLYRGFTDQQCLIRLESRTGQGMWKTSRYSFNDHDFTEKHWNISDSDINDSYSLLLHPLEELLNQAESVFDGEIPKEDEPSDSTELIRTGHDCLLTMHEDAQMKADRYESLRIIMRAKMNSMRSQMEERMKVLDAAVRGMQRKSDTIRQVISWLRVYMGEGVNAIEICSGKSAEKDEPLSIRQRILFMDEEVAVLGSDGQGLDWQGKDTFYEWIRNPENRDTILPEQRCTVVMKPKRFVHRYSADHVTDRLLNEYNRHSFIMIRDGENIHAIESDDLEIFGTAIPTKAQYEEIQSDRFKDDERKSDAVRELHNRAMYYMMLLQGLADNTDVFGCHNPINITKEQNVRIILDAEKDTMIGTGIKPFKEWIAERRKDIKRGDRIIFRSEYRNDGSFLRTYYNDYSKPEPPKSGLYSVDEAPDGRLVFRYMPGDKVFNQSEGWYTERRNRVAYVFDRNNAINFDTTSLEELEAYLKDRTQREHYVMILGLLLKMREIKRQEEMLETHFVNLLEADLLNEFPQIEKQLLRKAITESVKWWKTKVIFKRPLSQDDKKAWRMIRNRTTNKIFEKRKNK